MNSDTLLHRQIDPVWVQCGRVTSQAFSPTPKDQCRLSVYNGELITAEHAWNHFTHSGYKSVGVLAVTVCECWALDLNTEADPIPFPEHAVIVFAGCTTSQLKSKAKQLTHTAQNRGWQWQAGLDS